MYLDTSCQFTDVNYRKRYNFRFVFGSNLEKIIFQANHMDLEEIWKIREEVPDHQLIYP